MFSVSWKQALVLSWSKNPLKLLSTNILISILKIKINSNDPCNVGLGHTAGNYYSHVRQEPHMRYIGGNKAAS
jgi:hypothetical protein